MKKTVYVLTILMLVFLLSACAEYDCNGCGKKNGGVHHVSNGKAEMSWMCDECIEKLFIK